VTLCRSKRSEVPASGLCVPTSRSVAAARFYLTSDLQISDAGNAAVFGKPAIYGIGSFGCGDHQRGDETNPRVAMAIPEVERHEDHQRFAMRHRSATLFCKRNRLTRRPGGPDAVHSRSSRTEWSSTVTAEQIWESSLNMVAPLLVYGDVSIAVHSA
jgi:hypothetical protein